MLAARYWRLDKYKKFLKAIEYYEKALASDLKTFGEGHPSVAIRWWNIGWAWEGKGQYKKALGYYEKALTVFLTKLGEEHPSTISLKRYIVNVKEKLSVQ